MASTTRPKHVPARAVGIKDIANAAGVSIGTVDRALHDKPGINPLTRARVLSMAESLGYRPNLAARHLKSPRTFRIAVHLPREIALFWDTLRDGILEAAAPYEPSIHVEFGVYPRLGEGDVPLFKAALEREVNGLIIAPGDPVALRPWIRRAAKQNVPVVCVVTDAPGTERLTSVSADPFTVGAVAGEMLSRFLPAGGSIAFFTGWLGIRILASRVETAAEGPSESPDASGDPVASPSASPTATRSSKPDKSPKPSRTPAPGGPGQSGSPQESPGASPGPAQDHPISFLLDPSTSPATVIDLAGEDIWRPIVNTESGTIVYWSGTLIPDATGTGWELGAGRLVIDGKGYSWDELGHMVMSFEGFRLKMEVYDRSEER